MVERVARAMMRLFSDHAMQYQDGYISPEDWDILAHAALVAMREPTEEMVNAVRATVETSDTHIDLSYKAKEVWCEMIDAAALKD